jgi:hypothetical protein
LVTHRVLQFGVTGSLGEAETPRPFFGCSDQGGANAASTVLWVNVPTHDEATGEEEQPSAQPRRLAPRKPASRSVPGRSATNTAARSAALRK